MNNILWEFSTPLKTGNEIKLLENKYHYALPNDLKIYLSKHNGGVPVPSIFDIHTNKNLVFGKLLSLNTEDLDNVYIFLKYFEQEAGQRLIQFPFGLDPFGNLFCVQDNKIVFWNHESEENTFISSTFTELLNMLHD